VKHSIYILTGSNLGDKKQYLLTARNELSKRIGTLIKESSLYESEPWGFTSEDSFLNQVLLYETCLSPHEILEITQQIEYENGRVRTGNGYTSRNLDIDILFYDDLIIHSDNLTIPHPRLHERKFTLLPLNEIAPNFVHPVIKSDIANILNTCEDKSIVNKIQN